MRTLILILYWISILVTGFVWGHFCSVCISNLLFSIIASIFGGAFIGLTGGVVASIVNEYLND